MKRRSSKGTLNSMRSAHRSDGLATLAQPTGPEVGDNADLQSQWRWVRPERRWLTGMVARVPGLEGGP